MIEFPKEIYAAPEGQFGQGVDPIRLAPWTSKPVYERSQAYVRSDIADEMLIALTGLLERYHIMGCGDGPEALAAAMAIRKAEGAKLQGQTH